MVSCHCCHSGYDPEASDPTAAEQKTLAQTDFKPHLALLVKERSVATETLCLYLFEGKAKQRGVPHTHSGHANRDNIAEALNFMNHSICVGQFFPILIAD